MKLRHYIICLALALLSVAAVAAPQPPRWEVAEQIAVSSYPADGISIEVRDYYIYVSLQRPATVQLYTILGQPVASASLQAGTSRIRVSDRGIYILKAGTATRRVNV